MNTYIFSETRDLIEPKLKMIINWVDLYKASFHFGFVQKSKMATTTRHFLTHRTQWKYELKAFSQKLQTVHT